MNASLKFSTKFLKVVTKHMTLALFFPLFLTAIAFLYINRQPELYRVSINVDLHTLDRRNDLRDLACTAYISTNLYRGPGRNADFWLSGLPYIAWLDDYSCFSINSLSLIKYYLHFYNTSKIFPDLSTDPEFSKYLKERNLNLINLERSLNSTVSFLYRQDTMLVTIAMKGSDLQELKYFLKTFTRIALRNTQLDINRTWTTILSRMKMSHKLSAAPGGKVVIENIEKTLLQEATKEIKPEWNEQFFVERLGPNKIAVTLFGLLCGIFISFFILVFLNNRDGEK